MHYELPVRFLLWVRRSQRPQRLPVRLQLRLMTFLPDSAVVSKPGLGSYAHRRCANWSQPGSAIEIVRHDGFDRGRNTYLFLLSSARLLSMIAICCSEPQFYQIEISIWTEPKRSFSFLWFLARR